MKRGPDKTICHLDQFRGQLYRAVYLDGSTLVQFSDAMQAVFEAIQTISSIEIGAEVGQWQSRKKGWDKEWDIKNGGPSPEVRLELLNQRTWLYKGIDGKLAHKPLKLDSLTLSMLPPGLSIAADINNLETRHFVATAGKALDQASPVDRPKGPYTEACGSDHPFVDASVSTQGPWQSNWAPQTMSDTNNLLTTPTAQFENLCSLFEDDTMDLDAFFGQQQHSPTMPQYGPLAINLCNTYQPTPSNISSNSLDDLSRHGYPPTMPRGQADDGPTQSIASNVYRPARDPANHDAHAARVVENGWSAPLQPIQRSPAPIVESNILDSHVYTGQQ